MSNFDFDTRTQEDNTILDMSFNVVRATNCGTARTRTANTGCISVVNN